MTINEGRPGWERAVFVVAAVAGCVALDVLVAFAIFNSSYGSTFFLADDSRSITVWLPVLTGVAVGFVQALTVGFRTAAAASVLAVLGAVVDVFVLATLLLTAVGGIAGSIAAGLLIRWVRASSAPAT